MENFESITTQELLKVIDNSNSKILDLRCVDAYNGWITNNEKRGGHIKNSKSLDIKWANYIDWVEIVRSKGISKSNNIILYSDVPDDCIRVAKMLDKLGYKNISIYYNFIEEWSSNTSLPMEQLARFRNLVSVSWLRSVMIGEKVQEAPKDRFVIVHSHYRNRDAYLSGHIPGAIDMDTLALETPETWNRRSPAELKLALEKHGICSDTTVILYGKFMHPDNNDEFPGSAAGHIGAIRNAFIMLYAGVKDVRILNGGFQAWEDANLQISTSDITKIPISDFGADIPANPELAVDIAEAKKMIKAENADIVCVRSWPEYIGVVSGYNYIEKKGRIPGAIFGNCGSDAYHMENYRNLDYTIREANEVINIWKESGITPDKHLAFYCGTGWRGSEAFFNAWLMGWSKISVFDGGWFEWSKNPNNPYETGIPTKTKLLQKLVI